MATTNYKNALAAVFVVLTAESLVGCLGIRDLKPPDATDASTRDATDGTMPDAPTATDAPAPSDSTTSDAALDGGGALACANTSCATGCTNLQTDAKNCGACGHDCTALKNVTGVSTCSAGLCSVPPSACAAGWTHCSANANDGCETDISKPNTCGGCSTVCPATAPQCSGSGNSYTCVTSCTAPTPTLCGSTCVDTTSNASYCGNCMTSCMGGMTCQGGHCSCPSGTLDCSGTCQTPGPQNGCGRGGVCSSACPGPTAGNGSAACNGTACAISCSAATPVQCGTSCQAASTQNKCGTACNTACPQSNGTTAYCNGPACALSCAISGFVMCGGSPACTNLQTDVSNCGACGNGCDGGTCSGGMCQPSSNDCAGSPGLWNGCRGSGCLVCTELVSNYPNYFRNHPSCNANPTCQGLYYQCNAACQAPTAADL